MQSLLEKICHDLVKADHGNKAASQRVRTGTIRLEKVAKMYRKESIAEEKRSKGRKATKSHHHHKKSHHKRSSGKKKGARKH